MFKTYPAFKPARAMKQGLKGEDVYALQTALARVITPMLKADGDFGPNTASAVKAYQISKHLLKVDEIAGQDTNTSLAISLDEIYSLRYKLPFGLLRGQTEHESGQWLGNFSPERPDGTYDAGIAQRNTEFVDPKLGFNAPDSVDALAAHTKTAYASYTGIKDEHRRWSLAAGSWNAPAYANYLAGLKKNTAKPSEAAAKKLEAYMVSVTKYLVV